MTILDQIKERIAYQLSYWEDEPSAIHMSLSARMVSSDGKVEERAEVPLVTCKDCKHATMSTQGYCKYCDRLCANDEGEPDAQVNFDTDFFCGFAERRDA